MEENKLFVKLNIQRFATHLVSWDSYYLRTGQSYSSDGGDAKGEIRVYLESQNYANNTSYVRLDHYIYTKDMEWGNYPIISATSKYRVTGPNGSTSYQSRSKTDIDPYPTDGYILLGSTYHTVSHDVSGGGTFRVNGTINVLWGHDISRTRTTDFYVSIPTIPRYANITSFSIWQTGLNSIAGSVRADRAIDQIQYSLNGGSWTNCNQDFSITGLNPNTQYNVRTRVKSTASQLWTESGLSYATTAQINQITSANPSGNSDNELNVTATNPSGNRNDIKLEFPDLGLTEVLRKDNTLNATFTVAEMESLASLIPNANSTKLRATAVTVVNGNDTYWHYKDGTYTVLNANPTFSNFEYEDVNQTTLSLTGNNKTIIKGYSNLRARVTTANKMIANKGANPIEYQLVVGSKQIKANYSSSTDVDLSLNTIDNNVFIVYAIDSRGNSTPVQKSPEEYIDYFKPVINELVINRENNISTFVNLNFTGTFFNVDFGAEINEITAKYQYRNTKSDEWIIGDTELTLDINDNNFSFNDSIAGDLNAEGFSISESFEIKIIVEDLLSNNEKSEILVSATPNVGMHQDGTSINKQYDDSLGSGIQLNGENIYYNGMLLFGWSDEMPTAMKNEEEIMEIESEVTDDESETEKE